MSRSGTIHLLNRPGLRRDLVIANMGNNHSALRSSPAGRSTRAPHAAVGGRRANRGRVLLPGLTRVRITVQRVGAPLVVPSTALVNRASGPQVMELIPAANGRGTVRHRSVQVARDFGSTLEIVSGLTDGALVATIGSQILSDGQTVRIAIPNTNAREKVSMLKGANQDTFMVLARWFTRAANSSRPQQGAGVASRREAVDALRDWRAASLNSSRRVQWRGVFSMLADDAAVREVIEPLIDGAPRCLVHVNMATISVALTRELAARHRERGLFYVASPVFGRPVLAESGKLTLVVAGDPGAIARVQPLFNVIGQKTWTMGAEPERANVVKLAGNVLLGAAVEAMAEESALASRKGSPQLIAGRPATACSPRPRIRLRCGIARTV